MDNIENRTPFSPVANILPCNFPTTNDYSLLFPTLPTPPPLNHQESNFQTSSTLQRSPTTTSNTKELLDLDDPLLRSIQSPLLPGHPELENLLTENPKPRKKRTKLERYKAADLEAAARAAVEVSPYFAGYGAVEQTWKTVLNKAQSVGAFKGATVAAFRRVVDNLIKYQEVSLGACL